MSAIGTDRLCPPVDKHFRCWRLTGGAAPVPALLSLTLSRRYEAARGPRQRPGSASTCGVARAPEGWHKIVHACSWHTSGAPFLSMSWARYFCPGK